MGSNLCNRFEEQCVLSNSKDEVSNDDKNKVIQIQERDDSNHKTTEKIPDDSRESIEPHSLTETKTNNVNHVNIVFHWKDVISTKPSEIKDDSMTIDSLLGLFLFFLRIVFLRNYVIPEDNSSFPHVDLFGDRENWWGWMGLIYADFRNEYFESMDISRQVENIIKSSSIIRTPWKGQSEIVIGCGHKFGMCQGGFHKDQYTVDCDPQMGSDCIFEFGNFSLVKVIPEAKGKIKKILLEGLLVCETPCFVNDLMELLKDGGRVYRNEDEFSIIKINGQLYAHKFGVIEPYRPWTLKIDKCRASIVDLGSDALDWTSQITKVREEDQSGIWDHLPKNPKTPFDPDFGR